MNRYQKAYNRLLKTADKFCLMQGLEANRHQVKGALRESIKEYKYSGKKLTINHLNVANKDFIELMNS